MLNRIYSIPAANFPTLQAKIAKLNNKAEKINCPPVVLTVLKTGMKKTIVHSECTHKKYEFNELYYECEISGQSPKINGWKLAAIIKPLLNDKIIYEISGEHCPPEYRHNSFFCEHCGFNRKRNFVFILKHDSLGHKQVGKTCLKDFLGHAEPEQILAYAENYINITTDIENSASLGFSQCEQTINLEAYVATCSMLIRKIGWVSSKDADYDRLSTSNIAWQSFDRNSGIAEYIRKNELQVESIDIEKARSAISWASELPDDSSSNYMNNLGIVARLGVVTHDVKGFAASLVNAYNKFLSDEIRKPQASKSAGYIGEIGKRQTLVNLTVFAMIPIGGIYPKTLIKFHDESGRIVSWFASGFPDGFEIGKKLNIKATIDKHEHYRDIEQTIIKRATII